MYSFPMYERLKVETPEFEQVAAFQAGLSQFSLRREAVDQIPKSLSGEFVTGKYLSTLGIRAFCWPPACSSDDQPAAPPVAVLSYHIWQDSYGADASVLGSSYVIGGPIDGKVVGGPSRRKSISSPSSAVYRLRVIPIGLVRFSGTVHSYTSQALVANDSASCFTETGLMLCIPA
jgi:hypothetical protein